MTTKHTPTPWKIGVANSDPRWWTIRGPQNEAIVEMAHWLDADPLNELAANAEFIVEAVNNYERLRGLNAELVEALETFLGWANIRDTHSQKAVIVRDMTRAVLAKAKEQRT